ALGVVPCVPLRGMAMDEVVARAEVLGARLARTPCRRPIESSGVVMYIHRMVRTQLYLDATVHRLLKGLARTQGRTVSELVRDALLKTYGTPSSNQRVATLNAIEGLWRNRRDIADSNAYVRHLRR